MFTDTSGHAAFAAMRARGARATDLVVLAVAADDGVMPQTLEALDHAREARVPVLVAVTKCDLPSARPERVRSQLADHGLIPAAWGGDVQYVDVSASGRIASLRRFQDDVAEVGQGFDCGLMIERFDDVRLGDAIEVYEIVRSSAGGPQDARAA